MRQVRPAQIGLPRSVDRYLLPDERSVITVRMHPAAVAGPLVLACGALVAVRKLTGRSPRPDIVWGAYLLVPLYVLRRLAAWPVTYFTVTDKRIMLTSGLLIRTATAMPLEKVTGLTLQRTVPGRLLGYGTLIITSLAASGVSQGQISALSRTAVPGDVRPVLAAGARRRHEPAERR